MTFLLMNVHASIFIIAIVFIRILTIHILPKKTFLVLWGIVVCYLLVPISVPSHFSIYTHINPMISNINESDSVQSAERTPVGILSPLYHPRKAAGEAAEEKSLSNTGYTHTQTTAVTTGPFISLWISVWIIGICICAIYFMISYVRYNKKFSMSLPVQNNYIINWLQAHSLRRRIQVRCYDQITSPLTYGILHPVILLPKSMTHDDSLEMQFVLAHEFIHIKRFDALRKMLLTAAVCVYWFNPLVWVMCFLYNRDIEISCDEEVLHTFGEKCKSSYAMMLIGMESKKRSQMPLCNYFSKYSIVERINIMMKMKKQTVLGLVLSAVLITSTTMVFATGEVKEETKEKHTVTAEQTAGHQSSVKAYLADNTTPRKDTISYEEAAKTGVAYLEKIYGLNLDGMVVEMKYGTYAVEENNSRTYWAGLVVPSKEALEQGRENNLMNFDYYVFDVNAFTGNIELVHPYRLDQIKTITTFCLSGDEDCTICTEEAYEKCNDMRPLLLACEKDRYFRNLEANNELVRATAQKFLDGAEIVDVTYDESTYGQAIATDNTGRKVSVGVSDYGVHQVQLQ